VKAENPEESLDETVRRLTGRQGFSKVWKIQTLKGIAAACGATAGFDPLFAAPLKGRSMLRMIDLHAHPYMKIFHLPHLANTFHAFTLTGSMWNPLGLRYQFRNLRRSPVKILCNTHYVVEKPFVLRGVKLPLQALLGALSPRRALKLATADPWKEVVRQMDGLEDAVRNTNRLSLPSWPKLRMVRSYGELSDLAENEIAMLHAIEGPHIFGYSIEPEMSPEAYWERTRDRLHYLYGRGMMMLTLGHFWDQPFTPQTDSCELIPKVENGRVVRGRDDLLVDMKRATWKWGGNHGLGEKLVREMFELGIIADLSHVQEHAREAIYDLADEYKRPVLLSHVGLKHFFDHEYNVGDAELKRIDATGGVIGLIFSTRLLLDPIKTYKTKISGVDLLVENMRYIRDLVGSVAPIAFGTDFDGMTHPFRDCYTPAHMDRVADGMTQYFTDDEIDAVFYGNAMRLFKNGWGERRLRAKKAARRAK
jgi:microsomal dipeptidase-like Zn-dependent dipeptidase